MTVAQRSGPDPEQGNRVGDVPGAMEDGREDDDDNDDVIKGAR